MRAQFVEFYTLWDQVDGQRGPDGARRRDYEAALVDPARSPLPAVIEPARGVRGGDRALVSRPGAQVSNGGGDEAGPTLRRPRGCKVGTVDTPRAW
jgi:hypothetical protein